MSEKAHVHQSQPGDIVEITGHRVGDAPRSGEILEVIGPAGSAHFLVRWEDGHESLLYPSSDTTVHRPHARTEKRA